MGISDICYMEREVGYELYFYHFPAGKKQSPLDITPIQKNSSNFGFYCNKCWPGSLPQPNRA